MRGRVGGLAHLHVSAVGHSLWGQGPLGAYNGVLLGCLGSDVGTLRQRGAESPTGGCQRGVALLGVAQAVAQAVGWCSRQPFGHLQ